MGLEVRIIPGPPTDKVSREAAEQALIAHPQYPKTAGVSHELNEVEGRWVAAIAIAKDDEEEKKEKEDEKEEKESSKQSAPPPFMPGDADGEDAAPSGPPTGDDAGPDDEEGPPKDEEKKPPHEKGGEAGELKQIMHMLTTLLGALGIDGGPSPEDGMIPGADAGPPPGPPGPPPGGPNDKQTIRHERGLKPGESPPGSTPVGAPSFASVSDSHPWRNVLGQKRTFKVEERIGNASMAEVHNELAKLAEGTGYRVAQLNEGQDNEGHRVARALIAQ